MLNTIRSFAPVSCINVAIGKPASQSSYSPWSTANDAQGAVTGVMPAMYGFHTNTEPAPWWMVDLLEIYPIERIVIHNRLDAEQARARTCCVEVSSDCKHWEVIHSGLAHFSGGDIGPPLVLPLACEVSARFVRVSLTETGCLHLAQVEVFGNLGVAVRKQLGAPALDFLNDLTTGGKEHLPALRYWLESRSPIRPDFKITGLKLTFLGRLGNLLAQLINAVAIARRLGLRYIVVLQQGMIRMPERFTYEGIDFIADLDEVDQTEVFLAGSFYFEGQLSPLLNDFTQSEKYRVVQDAVLPHLMSPLPVETDTKYDDEVTIHLRAGDIFSGSAVNSGYVQPPLAYYKLIVRDLTERGLAKRVRLVFEDRGNPCVDAMIDFLTDQDIPFRVQSGTLMEDLVALIDSRYLVFGLGTFGVAVALLSRAIDTVYCFNGLNQTDYEGLPSVGKVVDVRDHAQGYIKYGEWDNSPEKRRFMIEYPESALTFS